MSVTDSLRASLAGRYIIVRELGRGGMATVYLAHDVRHERDVAIKVLHPELGEHVGPERFQREIRFAARLQHPNILTLFDSGEANGLLFYVMPFVSGESLRDRLRREGQLAIPEAVRIAMRVAEALAHSHAAGLVHRDIKPENILLSGDNVFVADFGVARAVGGEDGSNLTSMGLAVGTPNYMSPEQATADRIDGRSDIYSLGCVLYEMLSGETPYSGPSPQAVIARHLQATVPGIRIVRPTVPDELQHVIEVAMSKSPADRWQTAGEFAAALAAAPARATGALGAASSPARTGSIASATTISGRFRRASAVTKLVTLGVFLVAVMGWAAYRWAGREPTMDGNLLLVAPFNTFDEGLDGLRNGLVSVVSQNLEGAGSLRTVAPTRFQGRLTGQVDQASVTNLAREVGAGIGVVGSISREGTTAQVKATVLDVRAGVPLGEVEVSGDPSRVQLMADSVTLALIRILVRKEIGNVQLSSLRSSSLPALKAFLQGEQLARRAMYDSAAFFFRRATVLDPTFTLAFQRLSFVNVHQGTAHAEDSVTWEPAIRAGQLNRGLAHRESLLVAIDSIYAALSLGNVRDDVEGAALRVRLLSSLQAAADRYPDDAEVAFRDAHARMSFADKPAPDELLRKFDRAIAVDSSFAPAYVYAIELAMRTQGRDAAVRHIEAYLRLDPSGVDAEGMRLALQLLADARPADAEIDRLIRAASVEVAFSALQPIGWWFDEHDTAIRLARRIATDPAGAPALTPDPDWGRFLLGIHLARRGHFREATTARRDFRVTDWLGSQIATIGGLDDRQAAATYDSLLRRPVWPQVRERSMHPIAFSFWGRVKDTVSLARAAQRADSGLRGTRDEVVRLHMRYLGDAARAYRAVAIGDSADALRRFLSLPDSVCAYCEFDKLARIQLLRARGRLAEAARLLARPPALNEYPTAILWELERGRVAFALGDTALARRSFTLAADAWARGDPVVQPLVKEARDALQRLGGS